MSGVQRLSTENSEGQSETDKITSIELDKNRRVLYFSDGTMEVDTDSDEIDVPDRNNVEFQEAFSFWSRVKNNVNRLGEVVLGGLDYVGEELALFLGITTKPELKGIDSYRQNTSSVNPEEINGNNGNWMHGLNNNQRDTPTRNNITSAVPH